MCQEKEREMESFRREIKQLKEEDEKRRQVSNIIHCIGGVATDTIGQ